MDIVGATKKPSTAMSNNNGSAGLRMGMSTDLAEDSPIQSIFYCEFHPTFGPRIVYQVPADFVTKEAFDSLSDYLIPKTELERRLLTVNALGLKIIGYPVGLCNTRYARNRLIFNLCFVCKPFMRTFQYEPIVKKLANYLINLELECEFLSKSETKQRLPQIMAHIQDQLNAHKVCKIDVTPSTTINLKIVKVHPDPEPVQDEQVPVFITAHGLPMPSQWDLTTQQIIPYIDGFRHIARIAAEADVEVSLVKACIQNMIYYGIIKLIPIFQYSNFYVPTHRLVELNDNLALQHECMCYVAKRLPAQYNAVPGVVMSANRQVDGAPQLPTFRSIFKIYCSMNYGVTIRDLCIQYNPNGLNIDEKKLVKFGLMKGMIRRVHRYPVLVSGGSSCWSAQSSMPTSPIGGLYSGPSNNTSPGFASATTQQLRQSSNQAYQSHFSTSQSYLHGQNKHHRHTPISMIAQSIGGPTALLMAQDRYKAASENGSNGHHKFQSGSRMPYELFDGNHNYDQICCKAQRLNLTVRKLTDEIDKHEDILLIYK
ncbi:GATOR complex protein NPRL2, partial [Fragariocoptes setiger]